MIYRILLQTNKGIFVSEESFSSEHKAREVAEGYTPKGVYGFLIVESVEL